LTRRRVAGECAKYIQSVGVVALVVEERVLLVFFPVLLLFNNSSLPSPFPSIPFSKKKFWVDVHVTRRARTPQICNLRIVLISLLSPHSPVFLSFSACLTLSFPLHLLPDTVDMASEKVFSLHGQGLKLDSAEDLEKHIKPLRDNEHVEEVLFGGNTLGVQASKALAAILETKKNLKVYDISLDSNTLPRHD